MNHSGAKTRSETENREHPVSAAGFSRQLDGFSLCVFAVQMHFIG